MDSLANSSQPYNCCYSCFCSENCSFEKILNFLKCWTWEFNCH